MSTLSQFLGGSSGSTSYALTFSTPGSFTAPFPCNVTILAQAPGGSGASNTIALGGNSGAWALKQVSMNQGDVLNITPGTGGAAVTGGVNGNPGSGLSINLNGGAAFLTATGGEGGLGAASGTLNPAAAASAFTGADVSYPGVQAGAVTGGAASRTGGAAPNLVGDGSGRSPSASVAGQTAGGSVGRIPSVNATSGLPPLPTVNFASFGLFPLSTTGLGTDSLGTGTVAIGNPFAGGGAVGNTGTAGSGMGGGGGGGGGAGATSGAGGNGYVCLNISKI